MNDELMRHIVESAKEYAIFTLDFERRVSSWNVGAQAIFGFSEAEILGQRGDIVFTPEDREAGAPEHEARKAITEGRAVNERVHLRKDGTRFYGSGLTTPLHDDEGNTTGFVKIMRDLTEQKRAEDALAASEEKYRMLFNSIDEGYFLAEVVFDTNDRPVDIVYLDANPSATRMVGENYVGRRLTEINPAFERHWLEIFGRVARTGQGERLVQYAQFLGAWYDFYLTKVGGQDSRRVALVFQDISRRKRLEANLAFLAEVSQDLLHLTNIKATMSTLGAKIGAHFGISRCAFVGINEVTGDVVCDHDWHRADMPSLVGTYQLAEFFTPDFLRTLQAGEAFVTKDRNTDSRVDAKNLGALNIASLIVIPINKEGQLQFSLGIYDFRARDWQSDEVELMRELTTRIWTRLEHQRVEEAMREREERLRLVVESVTEYAIITHDIHGFITSWNSGAERSFGWTANEATGLHSRLIFTPEDRQAGAPEEEMQTALREGRARDERWHLRKDGSRLFMSGVLSPLYNGGPHGFVKIARDLTREQQAESALRASEARFRTLSDTVPQIIWTNEAGGKANYFNSRWFEYSGRSLEDSIGLGWQVIVHPDDAALSVERWNAALVEGEVFDTEYRLRRFDGQYRWFIGRNVPLRDEEGHVAGWFGSATDIQELKEAQQAARESEERQRIAVDAGELATWDWDVLRDEIYWNERHFLILGMVPREGLMQADDFTSHVHPDDRERVEQSLAQSLERAGVFESEFRIVREDNGLVRWMSGYGRTTESHEGRTTRMSGVMFDSTERREAQEELRRSHEELEARTHALAGALQQVQGLVKRVVNTQEDERGRISRELHDNLGQHLTAVMLGLQTLEMQLAAMTGGKRQGIPPQLDQLRALVDGLMRAAHRQAWELRPAELDALGLEAALGQYIRDWSERTGVEVHVHSDGLEERPSQEIETTFYRVVQEALTNVARHARATTVNIILERDENTLSVIVEDDGVGFDTEESTGRLGVLGMQERLELVGGTLDIESIPGDGTTVLARVPLSLGDR